MILPLEYASLLSKPRFGRALRAKDGAGSALALMAHLRFRITRVQDRKELDDDPLELPGSSERKAGSGEPLAGVSGTISGRTHERSSRPTFESLEMLLKRAWQHWQGATLLCVTHDGGDTRIFDQVLVIEQGRVVEHGSPELLHRDPQSPMPA
ncbi:MAG: hypothetical protein L0Z50_10655 [Verrucomicrobiales bacterium]|nr:hypothetical protein [Verrucomicrobiales bacterium]